MAPPPTNDDSPSLKPSLAWAAVKFIMGNLRSWATCLWELLEAFRDYVRSGNLRFALQRVLELSNMICKVLMLWQLLKVVTQTACPIMVVLSGSMEPAFYRGDILFLHMCHAPFRAGDVVVFSSPSASRALAERYIPIVHRVVHEKPSGEVEMLTKGDNNLVDDRGLYPPGQSYITQRHVIGRAKGYLPYLGMVTIVMNDYYWLKYTLIGIFGGMVLIGV